MNTARHPITPRRTQQPRRRRQTLLVSSSLALAFFLACAWFGAPARAAGGAFLVKDISTTTGPLFGASIHDLTPVGSVAFFTAENTANGRELWKTDGWAELSL